MKKCAREVIVDHNLFGMYVDIIKTTNGNYNAVVAYDPETGINYRLVENESYVIATGKELKGYVGHILRLAYTGGRYGEGDIILEDDYKGFVCKWKEKKQA